MSKVSGNGQLHKRIVVKIGSSLLTEKSGRLSQKKIVEHVRSMSAACDAGYEIILVSSGSIAAGFERLGYVNRPTTVVGKQASAAVGQGMLIQAYSDLFEKYEKIVAQVLLSRRDFSIRQSYNNAMNSINLLLEKHVIPIVNENDTVSTNELTFGDNDVLAALVSALLHSERLVILTDTAGLFDSDPAANPDAKPIDFVEKVTPEILGLAGASRTGLGTGGMKAKLEAAKLALSLGVPVFVGLGGQGESSEIVDIMAGKGQGTYFGGEGASALKRKKQWIAFLSEVKGRIGIDSGAVRALVRGGKSLLPAGVTDVKGVFEVEDVIEVYSNEGTFLGKGKVNYSSSELLQVLGMSSSEAREVVSPGREEVIHRDDWVSLAE